MDQTNILVYVSLILMSCVVVSSVKKYVGPHSEDKLVLRANLCQSYFQFQDGGGQRIEDMEKMCWRTDRPVPKPLPST